MVNFYPESVEGKIQWLRDNIRQEDWQTKTGAEIQRELSDIGFKLRTDYFYQARREALNMITHQEQIQNLRPDSKVPESWVTSMKDIGKGYNYVYQFSVKGINPTDQSEETRYLSFVSDDRLTIQDVQDQILALLQGLEAEYNFKAYAADLFRVYGRSDRSIRLTSG
jgi:hypothetical protein